MLLQVGTTSEKKMGPIWEPQPAHMHMCSFVNDKVKTSTKQMQESVPPSDMEAESIYSVKEIYTSKCVSLRHCTEFQVQL